MQRNGQGPRKQNSGAGTGNAGDPTPTKTVTRRTASTANASATVSKPVVPQQQQQQQQQQRSTTTSTSTHQTQGNNGQPSSTRNTSAATRTSATATSSAAAPVGQQQQIPIRSGPRKTAAGAPTAATGPAKRTATAPPEYPDLKNERYIAELAVQRAVLATKAVLNSLPPPSRPRPTAGASNAAAAAASSAPGNAALGQVKMAGAAAAGAAAVAKADDSPVTIADFAGQALLIAALSKAFPEDGFLGEETADELRTKPAMAEKVWQLVKATRLADADRETLLGRPRSKEEMLALIDLGGGVETAVPRKRYWVMDPVDGTSAFLQGGQYAVALGLVQDGREILGVVACPNLLVEMAFASPAVVSSKATTAAAGQGWVVDDLETTIDKQGLGIMMAAVRGHGVTIREVKRGMLGKSAKVDRARLPPPPRPNGAPGPAQFSDLVFVDSKKSPKTLAAKVQLFAGAGYARSVQLYSSHMRYAIMALGDRSWAQIRWPKAPNVKGKGKWSIWDHVGTPLIYTQSGPGVVTDMAGDPLRYNEGRNMESTWGVITSDAAIHREIIQTVSAMLKN